MEVLLDARLNINHVSQEVLIAGSLELPVVCNEKMRLTTDLLKIYVSATILSILLVSALVRATKYNKDPIVFFFK